eukprot:3786093-Rhodomonas_salina.1
MARPPHARVGGQGRSEEEVEDSPLQYLLARLRAGVGCERYRRARCFRVAGRCGLEVAGMLRLEVNGPALRPRPTSPHPRRPPAPDLLLSRSQLLRVLPFSEPEPQKSVVGVTVLHCLELKHSKSHFQYEECGLLTPGPARALHPGKGTQSACGVAGRARLEASAPKRPSHAAEGGKVRQAA